MANVKRLLIIGLVSILLLTTLPLGIVRAAGDVTVEANATNFFATRALHGGIYWTSTTVGYVIYLDVNSDLVYQKTADGGATWAGQVVVVAPGACFATLYDCWADWQTAGDAGTKIHIVYIGRDTHEVRYVYLDTSGDSVGGDDLIETCQGTGLFGTVGLVSQLVSITKTRGGNLAVAIRYKDNAAAPFSSFYTSPDATTWTGKANPYEAFEDYCILFPGNEVDNQDVWAAYWDASTNEISLQTFDDSGNSWTEQLISANMTEGATYLQMDGAIRLSDGHLIFAAWNLYANALADLMVWDINGAGSITAKTDVLTNSEESFLVSVFINQDNDDIYATYAKGTAVPATVKVFYQLSQDGGANWDGQAAMQADAEGNERWISCGAAKKEWGGKFQPVWFNDDLNDIFCNTDNGISIAAAGGVAPTVTTEAVDDIEDTTATGHGTITATGGVNATIHGIEWDIDSSAPYDNEVHTNGDFGIGAFTDSLTGLPPGTTIYCRAYATNTAGTGYGGEVNFLTKPAPPVGTRISSTTTTRIYANSELLTAGVLLTFLSIVAFWKPAAPLFMLLAGLSLMVGLKWFVFWGDGVGGMAIGLGLIAYSLISMGYAFKVALWEGSDND